MTVCLTLFTISIGKRTWRIVNIKPLIGNASALIQHKFEFPLPKMA